MGRLLVTTSIEDSWDPNLRTVFLGEWCKKSNRQDLWSKIEAEVAAPYGLEPNQKVRDNDEKHEFYDALLLELSSKLNVFHQTDYSIRYWTILIGPWLDSFMMVVMNRYKSLEVALNSFQISKTILINQKDFSLTRNNYSEFRKAINSDLWNNALYVEILKNMDNQNVEILVKNIDNIKSNKDKVEFSLKSFFKKIFFKIFDICSFLSRNNDAFIINSYLPILDEIKLKILLGQIPIFWKSPELDYNFLSDVELDRDNINLEFKEYSGVERELRRLIGRLIPKIYIEGYEFMCKQANNLKWPTNPKFIYTSNNFTADDLFKFWLGSQVEQGTPYYAGQHGANYGTHYASKNWTELNTVDRFYSWGWQDVYQDTKTIPAFNFKVINKLNSTYKKDGFLLLVERSPGTRDGIHDRFYETWSSHKEMLKLYGLLSKAAQKNLLVRMHHRSSDFLSWQTKYQSLKIDTGKVDIFKLIKKSRLAVFNYDSAGLLELLALNIPVVCFWEKDSNHLLPQSKKYYNLLKSVNILFDSPSQVADHINVNWDDIDSWWYSSEVQDARIEFCKQYSKVIKNPVNSLKNLLLL